MERDTVTGEAGSRTGGTGSGAAGCCEGETERDAATEEEADTLRFVVLSKFSMRVRTRTGDVD
jgi:hypothetical protein